MEIPYCHWKSTTAIADSLKGQTDLDLLVAADRGSDCSDLLKKLGFRRAFGPLDLRIPEICHYFGHDTETGILVHVHLHLHLIIGDDLLKNYHLPVEDIFLSSAATLNGIKVPAAEAEFIMFVLRMTLKRRFVCWLVRFSFFMGSPLSLFKYMTGLKFPALSPSAQAELEDLGHQIREDELEKLLTVGFPFIDYDLFQECRRALEDRATPSAWIAAGKKLAGVLSPYRRYPVPVSWFRLFRQSFKLRSRSLLTRLGFGIPQGKLLESGGRIIAFAGGDGAGKTTMVDETSGWLDRYFSVARFHMGKPSRGMLWYVVLGLLKARALIPGKSGDALHRAVKFWLVARYRFKAFCRATRLRRQGVIVLLDRVPLPGGQYMDVPRISGIEGFQGPVLRLLAAMEEKWHARIVADDLIVLRLDPKIAAQRRPHDDQDLLAKRSGEIWTRNWPVSYAHLIDASRPLNEVISRVRSTVWKLLGSEKKVFELIGPAGSGKSTLAEELRSRLYNVRTTLSWHDGKRVFLFVLLQRIPNLVHAWLKGVPVEHLKIAIGTESLLTLLHPGKRRRHFSGCSVILEAGPVFHLAFLDKESPRFSRQWLEALRQRMRETVDRVFWLDAPNTLLLSRINERSKPHRIKNLPAKEGERFLDDYRARFSDILGERGDDIAVTHIDAGNLSIAESADIVISQLVQNPL
jgi:thymidylate kinase